MSHIRAAIYLSSLFFLLALSGCGSVKEPELVSVEIADLSRQAGDGQLVVRLTYDNPNGRQLTVSKLRVEGMINQKALDTYNLEDRNKSLDKKSEGTLDVTFAFNPDNIYRGFLSNQFGVIGSKRVRITLNGEAEFKNDGKVMSVPLEYSEVYKIPD